MGVNHSVSRFPDGVQPVPHFKERMTDKGSNREAMQQLVSELRNKLDAVKKGGGESAVKRHKDRGKMFVRDRIDALLDPDTPFLETSALAANGMYNDDAPAAGMVTGIGVIHGHQA